ncbi:hypothetical protein [uncultured Cyclobacterium sp.]|uniref:hypothetical protein n=1 Tax=uncultured Cyclobacterium sp. TaxID=453820 RepID=UPI0030ED4C52|tara:strand:+ start:94 stop:1446 length:1353 start_codon:yes stop_codon:yes gene_type:complete
MKATWISLIFTLMLAFSTAAQVPPTPSTISNPSSLADRSLNVLPPSQKLPFKEEIKQIHALKEAYDSLNQQIKKLKTTQMDSARKDSLINAVKTRGQKVLEQEKEMLQNLISSENLTSDKLKNNANYLLKQVELSKEALQKADKIPDVEEIIVQNEENLKALSNEWLMPEIEQQLSGRLDSNIDPRNVDFVDFYGKGAMKELGRENVEGYLSMAQAKSVAKEKTKDISNEYLQNIGNNYSKINLDSLGNIKVTPPNTAAEKFSLKEPNTLKKAKVLDRMGLYLWYDPLTSFGEGVFGDFGIKYSISSQWHTFAGLLIKRQFKNQLAPSSTGEGIKGGLRFGLGNWILQGELARSNINLAYAPGYESKNFDGTIWTSGIGVGRTIPMGKKLQSVVLLTWDPLFKENRSLSSSKFQFRIGFELRQLKKITQEIPKNLIPSNPRTNATSKMLD